MVKPEWGRKRTCQVCGKKYYDLNKSPMICPSCGAEFDPDLLLKNKKGKSLSTKVTTGNDNELTEDISNIDYIEVDDDNEVVSDDDPLLEINKEEQNDVPEDEIVIDDDISFIDDEEIEENDISDDNGINVEIDEENKN
jgi:uncharacterized protein (TIGR02300 family)